MITDYFMVTEKSNRLQNRTERTLFWNIVPRPLAGGIREQTFDKTVNAI